MSKKPKEISIVFPHQLFESSPLLEKGRTIFLVEEWLFFRQYKFHKQKLAFHRASMKYYEEFLKDQDIEVVYVASDEESSDIRRLIDRLSREGVETIYCIDTVDDWLSSRIKHSAREHGIETQVYESPMFLNTREVNEKFFKPSKSSFFQTTFYKQQRKRFGILLDEKGNPEGGKWTFDTENRKKYPSGKVPPTIRFPDSDRFYTEAVTYVDTHFRKNPGKLSSHPLYPYTHRTSGKWLRQFLENRLLEFGDYEDAIVSSEHFLNHSALTPMLNAGLITPAEVLDVTMQHANKNDIPISSLEGFVRQIIGWREFIRGIYEVKGRQERTTNFWGFTRKIPPSFYTGETGIHPVDVTIKKVLKTGYCHHIERLMILGNFMLLCEFDPDDVYRWFMELFIDAYDWVMVPNVYGMSQFADGGLMSTKPYISGSNYILKMSNYKGGDWQEIWDALFWRFMDTYREFFIKNPRLSMLVRNFDKMSEDKKENIHTYARNFLNSPC